VSDADLGSFIATAGDLGRFDSEGVFTISQREAFQKLGSFQLPRSEAWILKILQAAVASGATRFEIKQLRDQTWFHFTPAKSLKSGELAQAILAREGSKLPALDHLSVGLRAVGFGGGRKFAVRLGEDVLGWDGCKLAHDQSPFKFPAGGGATVCVGVAHPEKSLLKSEMEELANRAEVCPIPIFCNGSRLESLSGPLVDPGHGLGRRVILSVGWCPYSSDWGLPELTLPSDVRLQKHGLRFSDKFTDDRVFLVDGDPAQRSISSVTKLSYGYHVDSHRSSMGRFRFHNKPRHSYIHWVRDGVVVDRHRWKFEPSAVAFDLYLSAHGLPTDISGLRVVRRPDVAHRVGRALPWVSLQAQNTSLALSKRVPRPFGYHAALAGLFGFLAVTNPAAALFQVLAGGVAATQLALSLYDKHQLMADAARHLERVAQDIGKKL
jgi:hypothetical protein